MTEEIYNKATNLRSLIEIDKKALKYWKEAVDATDETAACSSDIFRSESAHEIPSGANQSSAVLR